MAKNTAKPKRTCPNCDRTLVIETNFYLCNNSPLYPDNYFHICRRCLNEMFQGDNGYDVMLMTLHVMNRPFLEDVYYESENTGSYFRLISSLPQYRGLNWNSSNAGNPTKEKSKNKNLDYEIIDKKDDDSFYKQDKADILRMIGYDPFEYESEEDKRRLYSDLANYLTEDSLEDGFKLQACIEIVKGYNQIDKINRIITKITNNPEKMAAKSGGIKTLIDSKKNLLQSLLGLAKDNGISVNHNNNRSKGGNTLNGIVKKLNEIGLSSAELNLFDLQTSESIKQIADISNKSILEQLMLDENDYSDMLLQQREMITEKDSKLEELEEKNRLLKVEIAKLNGDIKTFEV